MPDARRVGREHDPPGGVRAGRGTPEGKGGHPRTSRYGGWRELQLEDGRRLESIVLPNEIRERLTRDLRAFRTSRQWYHDLGIPYRRGYLFHGPPGCGKTSLAMALASHFGMDLYLVNLSSKGLDDETLLESLNTARRDSILLLEDVENAFREDDGTSHTTGPTFSGLLNAIDGVAAQEGRVLIMTTNHLERLDPALVRPGRVDVEQAFHLACSDRVRLLFLRFYPSEASLSERLAERVRDGVLSVARLQSIFLEARGRPIAGIRGGCSTRWRSGRGCCRREGRWPRQPQGRRGPQPPTISLSLTSRASAVPQVHDLRSLLTPGGWREVSNTLDSGLRPASDLPSPEEPSYKSVLRRPLEPRLDATIAQKV